MRRTEVATRTPTRHQADTNDQQYCYKQQFFLKHFTTPSSFKEFSFLGNYDTLSRNIVVLNTNYLHKNVTFFLAIFTHQVKTHHISSNQCNKILQTTAR